MTVLDDQWVLIGMARSGNSARELLERLDGRPLRLSVDRRLNPGPAHRRWHHAQEFHCRS